MSPELDVPLTPSADQIRRREFVTVRRGYDPEQVRQYLMRVAEQVDALEELARTSRAPSGFRPAEPALHPAAGPEAVPTSEPAAPEAAASADPYSTASVYMADLLRTAEATARRVGTDAEVERERKLTEAGAEADRIRTDAQARAEAVRQEADLVARQARDEAERLLCGLDGRRQALVGELQDMRDRLLSMAHNLGALAAEHESGPAADQAETEPDPGPDPRYVELWSADEGTQPVSPEAEGPIQATVAEPGVIEVPEMLPARSPDPIDQLFADIPTLSLEDLDPGEFER